MAVTVLKKIVPENFFSPMMLLCSPYLVIFVEIQGAYDKFQDFFRVGTFIDSTQMKL